ncbi:ComF family protein [Singulisphaera acidiphila]|nr:ComF family protein [Singulisphaera acidiphila]
MFATRQLQCWMAEGCRALEALVFPWVCPICEQPGVDSPFCESCRNDLVNASGLVCERCAMPLGPWSNQVGGCFECRGRPLGFDAAIALGPYEGTIRDLCLRLKRESNAWLAPWLAKVLVDARAEVRQVPADSWVVPIPLHWRRQWQRGYNQADALARGISKRLSLRLAHPLRRVRSTPHLASAGRSERAKVMREVFEVRRRQALGGRTVLLVDDILTTGATCGAAARALKRAGAARVVVLVIGRAEGIPLK